ncbi:sensor histidine kinase [Maribacter polysaccharolyticus]|uniref:sensor histidine kinase n=1 Tax=Maribacter polysaccharolyticus TaxID=3020831 RepID=UPI00237F8539|nr:sensor histidine kinase [Maribacter polysaccharolyticus]MDE3741929.1 sensor histidine kinase [Maribacter polysaccharolyticus]
METPVKDEYRLEDKVKLTLRVNYFSSVLAIIFGFLCIYALDIHEILPYAFFAYGVINLLNTFAFKSHSNLTVTYNITSVLGLLCSTIITLFSGGINSPFIFVLALIVFTGYVTTKLYGKVYLYINLTIVCLLYLESLPAYRVAFNAVPEASRDLFSLFSILFSVYLLGGVLGKNLLKAHHNLYKSRNEIEKRIKEKETLLREVHHRVKNNLQTVSSLLSLQSRNIKDEKMKTIIKSSQNRVVSMAMVHEMLYMRDEDLSKIEYKSYVKELSEFLVRSIKGSDNKVKLDIDIPDIKLGIDTAIPLGLLINEAITNALKYGFPNQKEGEISISIQQDGDNAYELRIGDNGIGFPDTIDYKTTNSLGLKLIHNLARQLKGSIHKDPTKKGTNYIIKFHEVGKHFNAVA